ncbi:MAG: nuclear transport factor 2 family protein [Candidatus Riflebacteria bacterium]|nr:nuclear transport factor 2 family protein [Candidatus Riflebacteria bacterium]
MKSCDHQVLVDRFLDAWNSQVVDAVVACYTDDLVYRDPNTRGEVRGADAFRRYLAKLFATWRMHWTLREIHPLRDADGAAVLWHASFGRAGEAATVEEDGIDLVLVRDDRIARNDVCFDRTKLAPLMGAGLTPPGGASRSR